jgi:ubiquinone/menaquinone biosynthesis C-methylase UbiE
VGGAVEKQTEKPKMHACRYEFDQFVDGYRERNDLLLWLSGESSTQLVANTAQRLPAWLPELQGRPYRLLDFGCGDGVMTKLVATQFPLASVFGIDTSSESIRRAGLRRGTCLFSPIQGEAIPFEDCFFDVVIAHGVFHHIPPPERQVWLQEISRVLKPRGKFVLLEVNPLHPAIATLFRMREIERNAHLVYTWQARTMLRLLGVPCIKHYCFFPRWLKWFRIVEPYLEHVPCGVFYMAQVVKGE